MKGFTIIELMIIIAIIAIIASAFAPMLKKSDEQYIEETNTQTIDSIHKVENTQNILN